MKSLLTTVVIGILTLIASPELSAQTRLPQNFNPKAENINLTRKFSTSGEHLLNIDTISTSGLSSRLNKTISRPRTRIVQATDHLKLVPGKTPTDPKEHWNQLEINGNPRHIPQSNLGLMSY